MRYEILVDKTERANKCSILPLAYRKDFRIVRFDRRYPIPALAGNLLLHPEGRPLGDWKNAGDDVVVAAVDCNWNRLGNILERIDGVLPPLARIPGGFVTAYRRRNKQDRDPDSGLATVEALFLAAAFLGNWDRSLLAEYNEAGRFLEANAAAFARHGLAAEARDSNFRR